MPILVLNILEGKPQRSYDAFIQRVTDLAAETLDVSPLDVRVVVREMKMEHYAVGGETMAQRKQNEKRGH